MPNTTVTLATATEGSARPTFLFSDDSSHRHFRRTYRAARAAMTAGDDPLATFMGDPSSAPLCVPRINDQVGLMFGIELEYENGRSDRYQQVLNTENFGAPLVSMGLLRSDEQQGYHSDANETQMWRWEEDMSVSGGEVITPVLRDNRDSWSSLTDVVSRMVDNGAEASASTGGHIHIDSSEIGGDEEWARFANIIRYFEDELVRLATNPWRQRTNRSGRTLRTWHRNAQWSMFEHTNQDDLSTVNGVVEALRGRGNHITTAHVSRVTGNGHIEFRLWDGSLRMPLIQMQTKITAAIVAAAMNPDVDQFLAEATPHPVGWHRAQPWRSGAPGGAVRGEDWKRDTVGIKMLSDILFPESQADKEALVTLFALNPWGRAQSRRYW